MCLNFMADEKCHVNGKLCILGSRGALAKNEDHECELHGPFDVWVTDGKLLVTDLGSPTEEPIQTIALGVNEPLALKIASEKSTLMRIPLITSQRKCLHCGATYWVSQHTHSSGLTKRAYVTFCPECVQRLPASSVENKLRENCYWCG